MFVDTCGATLITEGQNMADVSITIVKIRDKLLINSYYCHNLFDQELFSYFLFSLLTIGNKLDLLCLLFPIANKWKEIGESLSITKGDLESLSTERSSEREKLKSVILIWFDTKTCPLKWSTIITAVELPPVYEPIVAESIMHKCLSVCKN